MLPKLDVIASRFLELRHEDGTSSPVVVRIGRPRRDAVDYRCDYEIEGLSKVRALHIRASTTFKRSGLLPWARPSNSDRLTRARQGASRSAATRISASPAPSS